MKLSGLSLFLALGLAAVTTPASAATYTISLGGDPHVLSSDPIPGGTRSFLSLGGPGLSSLSSVSQGDIVNLTVNLSSLLTVPSETGLTSVNDLFGGLGFDGSAVHTTGTLNFYNGSTLVGTFSNNTGTSGQIASGFSLAPGTSLAFTSYTDDFMVDTLASPVSIKAALFTFDSFSAAPEPETWMLTIVGMGMVGGAMRRRGGAGARSAVLA